jgi:drug/metabolite transporter (DMT)-like permease
MPDRLDDRPALIALIGAVCIAFSGIFVRLADVPPTTSALLRCAYAIPLLAWLARRERRRMGPETRRNRALAGIAGVAFAVDLIAWHHAIESVGAGLGTVLANFQVVLVAFAAWGVLGERPGARIAVAVPIVLGGGVLISGVLEQGAYGSNPALGVVFGIITAIAYTAFLLLMRQVGHARRVAGPLFDATWVSALCCIPFGLILGELDLSIPLASHAWLALLALTSQVLGWMLIGSALPRLAAALGSVLIMVQPVGSVGLGALLLGERPSPLQLVGVATILVGVLVASSGRRAARSPAVPAPARAV